MSRQLLTVTEAALISGVDRSTLFLAIRDEKLKAIKLAGRRRRIPVDALSEWLGYPIVLPVQR